MNNYKKVAWYLKKLKEVFRKIELLEYINHNIVKLLKNYDFQKAFNKNKILFNKLNEMISGKKLLKKYKRNYTKKVLNKKNYNENVQIK